ncbi:putative disease resistance RPP13-like protein 1 [Ziziphus jujuba]|uniref:Disease resistance RPP13-like protein 1 n=1 Tax=Ziziphus jujuba TaxID=326968 RepID=A0A6P4B6C0_ZIZJJ|nr:putative disease resistance RPP13-like protein 1 [Ziziphus jujuba]
MKITDWVLTSGDQTRVSRNLIENVSGFGPTGLTNRCDLEETNIGFGFRGSKLMEKGGRCDWELADIGVSEEPPWSPKTVTPSGTSSGYWMIFLEESLISIKGILFYNRLYQLRGICEDEVMKLKRLRVLSFRLCRNFMELSKSIGELKHLRYLDLSHTAIIRLPESITNLYNLAALNVSFCYKLTELPKDMYHLVSLQLLVILYTNIVEMSIGANDALEAKLMEKKYLEELVLCWNRDTNDSKHEKNVLDKLFPSTNLERLSINEYGGTTFPNWLRDGSIGGLEGVVSLDAEFYYGIENNGSSMGKVFALLEFFSFEKISNWGEWCIDEVKDGEVFPKLQQLEIRDCDRLELSHNFPSLTELIIDGDEVVISSFPRTPILCELRLGGWCEKLKLQDLFLPQTLETIAIGIRYWVVEIGPNLIAIRNCEKVEFPLHHSLRSSIETVEIMNSCGSLECFPLDFFFNLRELIIEGCKNLESLMLTKSLDDIIPLSPNGGIVWESFPEEGLLPSTLTELYILGIGSLKRLGEGLQQLTNGGWSFFDRIATREVVDSLRGNKLRDKFLNSLKTILSVINAVLDDMEEKQITNPNIKQWLNELEDDSYDADDFCRDFFRNIKAVDKKPSPRPLNISLTEESKVYGRDEDKDAIIKLLLTDDDHEMLNDAEEKQIIAPLVKEWLNELEDAAYDADDRLDEIATDALEYKLEAESKTGARKISNMDLIVKGVKM